MGHPWNTPRYKSWASDTIVTAALFLILLAATIIVDATNGPAEPPAYLTGLLGAAGMALFGAAGSDKSKREQDHARDVDTRTIEAQNTAGRAQDKADQVGEIVRELHPDKSENLDPPQRSEDGGEG